MMQSAKQRYKQQPQSNFSQLVQMIKSNAEINTENMQQMISKEYKIFKLMPEGGAQQEIDFVDWASNLKNKHPIAKGY